MFWDIVGFGILTGGYLMQVFFFSVQTYTQQYFYYFVYSCRLSASKTLHTHKAKVKLYEQEAKANETQNMFQENKSPPHLQPQLQQMQHQSNEFKLKVYIKKMLNYSVTFNSSFLIVGSLSEAYFYSMTMMGNILSVTLGFLYAFFIVHPFMYSLDKEIKSPYQYFEKRYR